MVSFRTLLLHLVVICAHAAQMRSIASYCKCIGIFVEVFLYFGVRYLSKTSALISYFFIYVLILNAPQQPVFLDLGHIQMPTLNVLLELIP